MLKDAWLSHKKSITAGALFLIGALIAFAVFYKGPNSQNESSKGVEEENSFISVGEDQINGVDETPVPETSSTTQSGAVKPVKRLTYTEAMKIYGPQGNNLRFQFVTCQGTPGRLSVKKGVSFMLDNRDNAKHAIAIGTQKYNLGAYGFAVVSVPKTGLYKITCDGGGSAEVLVQ